VTSVVATPSFVANSVGRGAPLSEPGAARGDAAVPPPRRQRGGPAALEEKLAGAAEAPAPGRTIHLRVRGTVRNPSVQIDSVRLLTEAVRFFAGAAVGVPLP
jgi:hypothetical protein